MAPQPRVGVGSRYRIAAALAASLALSLTLSHLSAQVVPGKNVNMVAGTDWPGGDPFLQRQNEPSIAVSSRNELHLLAGANDYRTVDLPGSPLIKPSGDAWLGVFKSLDGGQTWTSTLLPGYPQDAVNTNSPLKGYDAGADPAVRAGSNGLFFYSGIAFQRAVPTAANSAIGDSEEPKTSDAGKGKAKAKAKNAKSAKVKKQKEKPQQAAPSSTGSAGVRSIPVSDSGADAAAQAPPAAGSAIFVSTYMDLNNRETGDPIAYVRTSIVDKDSGARFLDKQWIGVDVPRANASMCSFQIPQAGGDPVVQEFPGGRIYVAYTAFVGPESNNNAQIMVSYSANCGESWSPPRNISMVPDPDVNDDGIATTADLNLVKALVGKRCGNDGFLPALDLNQDCLINLVDMATVSRNLGKAYSTVRRVPQGATIAIHPLTGDVYIAWREFRNGALPDVIQVVRSTDFGVTFSAPMTVSTLAPYDQGTSVGSFRSNAFPTIAADASRVYLAWASRGYATTNASPAGESRIVMSTSANGTSWSAPYAIDEPNRFGHQLMPALTFGAGKLSLIYYDLREDVSELFGPFVDELPILNAPSPKPARHTMDVRLAQADPGPAPIFRSTQLSEYAVGVVPGKSVPEQLTFNPPNLTLFRQGTVPFMGDYIDLITAPSIRANADGTWAFNIEPGSASGGYAVWTDNRNVRAGPGGDLAHYTPPNSAARGTMSLFDPSVALPQCEPSQTGTRNQDIFSARFDQGLIAGALGNTKTLGPLERGFALLIQNTTAQTRSYRLTILDQPVGGQASFRQFGAPLTVLDVSIPRLSSVARTAYVSSSDPTARVTISVDEISAPGAPAPLNGGLHSAIVINGDASNPAIENPAIDNPAIDNKDIQAVEVYNPRINPAIENPAIDNPAIENPAIENPAIDNVTVANQGIINPAIENPAIENPAIENPAIENPAIENVTLANGSISDTTWTLTNDGNTSAVYSVKLLLNQAVPNGILTQLIIHKPYTTPAAAANCLLKVQLHNNILVNITTPFFDAHNPATPAIDNPAIDNPAIENPAIDNATVALAPGETAFVTVRAFDPDKNDAITFSPAAAVTPAAVAQSVNTDDITPGDPPPAPKAAVSTTIAVPDLADAIFLSGNYGQQLYASVPGTWAIIAGALPPGVSLSPTGLFSGVPTTPGVYNFTVQFTSSASPVQRVQRSFTVNIAQPLAVVTTTVPDAVTSFAYSASVNSAGGVNPKLWTVSSGALPAGVTLNSATGVLTGTPTATGTFNFTLQVVDSASTPNTASASFTLTVVDPANYERTWIGVDSNFSNPADWSPNGVPTATDDVLLNGPQAVAVLSANVSVHSLTLLNGATIDTNGFTLTVSGDLQAGNTITGSGSVQMTGVEATVSGTVSNLHVAAGASLTLTAPVHVTGNLTLRGGLALSGFALTVDGLLIVPEGLDFLPGIFGNGAIVTLGGVDVASLVLDNAPVVITNGTFVRFDNVQFQSFPPQTTRLTINSPGSAVPLTLQDPRFIETPTTGFYIKATDTTVDDYGLTIHVTNAQAANGPAHTLEVSGAAVIWATQLADLTLTQQDLADPVAVGGSLTYSLVVTNTGADTAFGAQLIDTLPPLVTFVPGSSSSSCLNAGGVVTCALGDLNPGGSVAVSITVLPGVAGTLSNLAQVFSTTPDPNVADNQAIEQTTVTGAANLADLSITKSHSPAEPTLGANLTYTLTVTNHGPSEATVVSLVDTLPSGVTFVSSSVSCNVSGTQLTCALNNLENGAAQNITITVTPTVSGLITNSATVTSLNVPDPNGANNVAQDSVLVAAYDVCSSPGWIGPTFVSVGSVSSSLLTTGDFNEDGNIDVVSSSQSFAQATLLLGNGAGGFAAPVTIALPSTTTASLAADVNHDNHQDILMVVTTGVHVLLGDGLGNFAAAAGSPFLTSSVTPNTLEKGFFNADAHLDVVVSSSTGSNIALLLGTGNGAFGTAALFPAGSNPGNVIVGDYDHDSKLDVAVPNSNGGTISVLHGDGLGGFAAPVSFAVPNVVGRLREVGDVNGDGWTDLGVTTIAGGGPNNLMLLLNDQDGGFAAATEILGPVGAGFVKPSDFNGDGSVDLAVVGLQNARMYILYGDGAGAFPTQTSIPVGLNQNSLWIADLNGDERPDIVGSRGAANNIYVLLNSCGSEAIAELSTQVSGPSSVTAGSHPTYTVTVSNAGSATATGVVLTHVYPAGMSIDTVTGSGVTCSDQGSNTLTCTLPNISADGSVSLDLHVHAFAAGTRTHQLMAIANQGDPDLNDNSTSITTTVTASQVTYVVTNTNDSGPGSLRQAILNSNVNTGSTNQIHFNIGAGPTYSIALLSALPTITTPVVIDGWTEGGAGYTGPPMIELNGLAAPSGNGLTIVAGGSTVRGLVINRFKASGIFLATLGGNTVVGNYVGTNSSGTAMAGNLSLGINVLTGHNVIGGVGSGEGNLVSGNIGSGILMNGGAAQHNQVIGNRVGTNAAGTAAIPNSNAGVQIVSGSNNTIGGPTAAYRNLLSGGANNGVSLRQGATNNTVQGNYIGVNAAGTAALPNGGINVYIGESSNNTVTGNVISGSTSHGLIITANEATPFVATGNVIAGNLIGTNAAGTAAVGNGDIGVYIGLQAAGNTVGGTTAAARNVISGNVNHGVVFDWAATNNVVQGNYIGTDISGTAIVANRRHGVGLFNTSTGNIIGGTASGAGNLISGNGSNGNFGVGVSLNNTTGNVILGNRIGTNAAGTAALPNANGGVDLNDANNNQIGGTTAGAGNLISGNGSEAGQAGNAGEGIGLFGTSANNVIQGNLIGTDATGSAALPNTGVGVILRAPGNTVGGTTTAARNVISGNGNDGIYIASAASGSVIHGNLIGTDITGLLPIPNFYNGVAVEPSASSISIGTIGAGNTIAFNSGAGVRVADGVTGVAIRGNSFFGNGGLGIDLRSDGVTANDPGDADTGANNLQNFPTITSALHGSTVVVGTLNSTPGTLFTLDFYANSAPCNASTEGQRYLGSGSVTTDSAGAGSFNLTLAGSSVVGESITATATDPSGNTSEFSSCVGLTAPPAAVVTIAATDASASEVSSNPGTFTVTRTGSTASALVVDFSIGGTASNGADYGSLSTSVTIPAGSASAAIVVTPIDDANGEGTETVLITLTDTAAYDVGSSDNATVTIADNDAASIAATDATASEVGDPATFTVSRGPTEPTTSDRDVVVTLAGTAAHFTDYTFTGNVVSNQTTQITVRIPAGASSTVVTLQPVVNAANLGTLEGNETVEVTAEGSTATATITDEPLATITATDPTAREDGDTASLTVSRGAGASTTFHRDVVVAVGGTATHFTDYQFSGNVVSNQTTQITVRIPAGATTAVVTVQPLANAANLSTVEGTESIQLTAEGSGATATIADEPLATVSASDATAAENGDLGTFVVSRGAGAATTFARDVVVAVSGTATNFTDYQFTGNVISSQATQVIVRIPAGQASATVTVTPASDAASEGAETVILTAEVGPTATINIADAQAISMALVNTQVVGKDRTAPLLVTLAQPAPVGGMVIAITSDNINILAVAAPGSVTIPEGQSTAQIILTGVNVGVTTLRGNASGFPEATRSVTVTLNIITTPSTLSVPLSQTTALSISIPNPAPAGGLVFDVVSANPSVVEVMTPQVTVPAGALAVNATVRGAAPGSASVTVSRSDYSASTTSVTSAANLNVVEGNRSFTAGFTAPALTVRVESAGAPVAVPSDLVVTLTPVNATCISVPASVTIPSGQVSATFVPAYGGSANLPCTSAVTASASGPTSDTVSITANSAGPITVLGTQTLGAGLQLPVYAYLGASQHGGVAVTITSNDPTRVLVSPNGTTAGSASVVVNVADGSTYVPFHVQGLENVTGSTTVTVSSTGFTSGSMPVNLVASAVQIAGLSTSTTSLSADETSWYVYTGVPNAGNTGLNQYQPVRTGGPAFVVTLTNSNAAVAQLKSDEPAATGQVVTKPIQPNTHYTQAVASGTSYGLAFDPLGGGSTSVTVTGPAGVVSVPAAGVSVTVTAPGITTSSAQTVGAGLQLSAYATLGGAAHGGVAVTITSSAPGVLRVSPNSTTAGTTSIVVNVPNGTTHVPFYVQGMENTTGSAMVSVSAPGFAAGSVTMTVAQAGVQILGLSTSATSLSADETSWYVYTGVPNAGNTTLNQYQPVRAGGPAFVVTLSNSNAAVAQLKSDEPAATGQVVTKPIQPNTYYTQAIASGTSYGLAFDPLGGGSTSVTVTGPAGVVSVPAAGVSVTVTAPGITTSSAQTVGAGLQLSAYATLGGAAHGGVAVTITSNAPGVLRVSPNSTTAGTTSIVVNVPNGTTHVPFYVQGMENTTGSAMVSVSAPGFTAGSVTMTVAQAGVQILGLSTSATSLSADETSWYVYTGVPNAGNTTLNQYQPVRAGGPAFVVTLSNSNAAVAQLKSDEPAATGQVVTKPIQPNTYYTQAIASGTSYGLAFDPLGGGSTSVTVTGPAGVVSVPAAGVSVTVTAPGITTSSAQTVGAGLQLSAYATLGGAAHGGVAVTITSSAPGVLRVSPNTTTAGTTSIVVNVPNGTTHVPFYVQGLENMSGTAIVSVSAPGFTTGTVAMTVAHSAVEISNLPASADAAAGELLSWYVRTGVPAPGNTHLASQQSVRAGGPQFIVTLSNSNAAVAELRSDEPAVTGQVVTKPIDPAAFNTGAITSGTVFGLSFRPLSSGTTTVTATGPSGVIGVSGATRTVSVTGVPTTVSIAATDADATEAGLTTGTLTITRSAVTAQSLNVTYTRSGSATAGSDYTNFSSTTATIPANQASVSITVTPVADQAVEGPETVTVTLANTAGYDLGASSQATVTIADDPTIVSIEAIDPTATEAGPTTGRFRLTRSGGSTAALSVSYVRSGTAGAGSDYSNFSATSVTIPAGQTFVEIVVTPLVSAATEPAETVILTLSSTAQYTLGATSQATVTITDS